MNIIQYVVEIAMVAALIGMVLEIILGRRYRVSLSLFFATLEPFLFAAYRYCEGKEIKAFSRLMIFAVILLAISLIGFFLEWKQMRKQLLLTIM